MPMLLPLPTSHSRLDSGWAGQGANDSPQLSLPVGFFPLPPAGGSGLFSPDPVVKHESHGQPEKLLKIEKQIHRPYAAFGLSMLVHAFALFGVIVALPQPPATTAPSAFTVSLISVASASEPLAAPVPPPPAPRQPQRVAKLMASKAPTNRPEIVTERDMPTENVTARPAANSETAPQAAPVAANANTAASPAGPTSPRTEEASPPQFAAAYLRNPAPAYPAHSRRMGEEGRVLLRVHVLANGQADDVIIHQSSSHERLDEAAIDAVRRWQFVPAKAGGIAIAAWVIVPIQFNLRGVG